MNKQKSSDLVKRGVPTCHCRRLHAVNSAPYRSQQCSGKTAPPRETQVRNQCCGFGSVIRCLFDPWIWDPEGVKNHDPGSGMNIPDNFSESLETIFGVKIL
jgi:hypothetical protein